MDLAAAKPIAICQATEVEAWDFPFWVKPAQGFEPTFLFLEEHLYNLSSLERETLGELVRVDDPAKLLALGFTADDEGVFRL